MNCVAIYYEKDVGVGMPSFGKKSSESRLIFDFTEDTDAWTKRNGKPFTEKKKHCNHF